MITMMIPLTSSSALDGLKNFQSFVGHLELRGVGEWSKLDQ
jgi:hypothetical protein